MREVNVANEILEEVSKSAEEKGGGRIEKAVIKIGELNFPKEVGKWLDKSEKEDFQGVEFEIIETKPEVSCECGFSGNPSQASSLNRENTVELACPNCGKKDLKLTGGMEKEVLEVKTEE